MQLSSAFRNSIKLYKMMIKNLKMATKYSFKVKPLIQGETEKMARAENFSKDNVNEQSIVIPTKGFSAVATKCLPNESEILIDTGPHFGGKIASENGLCGIEGDQKDTREMYTMRIDHEKCGSTVSHDDLTVETYITVQENSGILTHSTRRFLVVCTFQPDTLTVRARLALPSKGGVSVMDEDSWPQQERGARGRQFKMVDKSALVLKESSEQSMENSIGDIDNMTEKMLSHEKLQITGNTIGKKKRADPLKNARFLRYSSDYISPSSAPLRFDSIIGITVGIALTVLLIFIFFYIFRKDRKNTDHLERLHASTAF
jgi:hypothetical protein